MGFFMRFLCNALSQSVIIINQIGVVFWRTMNYKLITWIA